MDTITQARLITQLREQRKALFIIAIMSGLATLLLAIHTIMEQKAVVIVPAHISKEFEVSNKWVSEEYLELMSRDFIQSFFKYYP